MLLAEAVTVIKSERKRTLNFIIISSQDWFVERLLSKTPPIVLDLKK
jgi:hypothetical protein